MTEIAEVGERMVNRRSILGGLLWGSVGAAVGSVLGPAPAQAAEGPVIDMACQGDTFRFTPPPGGLPPHDFRGSAFSVEGLLYPAGTIPVGPGFDPTSATPIGTWLCRGWMLIMTARPTPTVISTQEYFLDGQIGDPARLFPVDQLCSSGLEGTGAEAVPPVRSVIGGAGRYSGVRVVT
jgi:hypothetical protein